MATTHLNEAALHLLEAIQAARKPQPEAVPPGWLTPDQVAKQIGLSVIRSRHLLNKLPNAEKRKFRVKSGDGVRPVWHYRLKV